MWIVGLSDANNSRARSPHPKGSGKVHSEESQREFCGSDEREDVADAERERQPTSGNGEVYGEACEDRKAGIAGSGSEIPADRLANANLAQREGRRLPIGTREEHADACSSGWWSTEPDVGRVANGVAARVDRLKCIGNGQVPGVASLAWRTLIARFEER